jgi:peptide/nickel transport system substrate-binding protein
MLQHLHGGGMHWRRNAMLYQKGPGRTARGITRRRLLAAGAGGLGAAVLAACGSSEKSSEAPGGGQTASGAAPPTKAGGYTYAPKTGRTREALTVGVAAIAGGLDPTRELSNVGQRQSYIIYDTLIRRQFLEGDKLAPALALSWERPDELSFVLKLRDGVTWHNGDPFTAEDVKYTFERIYKPDSPLVEARGMYDTFDQLDAVDRLTVRIRTKAPEPVIEKRLSNYGSWIVPKVFIEKNGGDEKFGQFGVGTGPFKAVRFEANNQLVMERNDSYWEEPSPLKKLTYKVIPEVSTRVTSLLNGETQMITNVPPDQVRTLQGGATVDIRDTPLVSLHVLRYNANDPVLKDVRIRQAMNLAIDRRLLIDTLWNGKAGESRSHQYEEYGALYNPNRPFLPHDPARAKALVAESGYRGDAITYRTQADYYTNGLQAAQAIVEMWKGVGLNAQLLLQQPGDRITPADVMVNNWSNTSRFADPDGALWIYWGRGSAVQKDLWPVADADFNRLGQEARTTLDERKRYDAYQRMLDIWEREAPGTVLYLPVENYGVSKEINWSPYTLYFMDFRAHNLSFNK